MNILLIDNDPDHLKAVERFLRVRQHEVRSTTSAEEGLAFLADRPAGLVLCDIQMPEMDGVEFLKAVRREHPDTAVVLVTGHATVDTAVAALRLGAADYLRKPIKLEELQACVRRVRGDPLAW